MTAAELARQLEERELRARRPTNLWRDTLGEILRQRSALVGLAILGVILFAAVFAPLIAPYDPEVPIRGEGAERLSPPVHPPARLPRVAAAVHHGCRPEPARRVQPRGLRSPRLAAGRHRDGGDGDRGRNLHRLARRLPRRLVRQRPDADHGRPSRVPGPRAGDLPGDRLPDPLDPIPGRSALKCHVRDRHRGDSGLCARHACLRPLGARA